MDINQGCPKGLTPLMVSADGGHSRIVRILLSRGANVSIVDDDCRTALHFSVLHGHSDVAKLLIKAGADTEARDYGGLTSLHIAACFRRIEATEVLIKAGADPETRCSEGFTPLHSAASPRTLLHPGASSSSGQPEVMTLLIKAGADPNPRLPDGDTPLLCAAWGGNADAVRVLLRAKANPLLSRTVPSGGRLHDPLSVAALHGHSEVVLELLQHLGIEGCGGESRGLNALSVAAQGNHVGIMAMLADAGVVDTGEALVVACRWGGEPTVKFLLQQHQQHQQQGTIEGNSYVNTADGLGRTALLYIVENSRSSSPRIVRRLVDAGADTTSTFQLKYSRGGEVIFDGTPLALTTSMLCSERVRGKDATEEQLNGLARIQRLLLQAEAVHAMSWLWHSEIPSVVIAAEENNQHKGASTSLGMTLPVLRRRARKRSVLVAPMLRWVMMCG